jgi:hypothetical protein
VLQARVWPLIMNSLWCAMCGGEMMESMPMSNG